MLGYLELLYYLICGIGFIKLVCGQFIGSVYDEIKELFLY